MPFKSSFASSLKLFERSIDERLDRSHIEGEHPIWVPPRSRTAKFYVRDYYDNQRLRSQMT
jgi:hypothetical protein